MIPRGVSVVTQPVSVVARLFHSVHNLAGNSFDSHVNSLPDCLLVCSQTKTAPWQVRVFVLVIPRGIEPRFPGWKPGVLTIRRWDHVGHCILLRTKDSLCCVRFWKPSLSFRKHQRSVPLSRPDEKLYTFHSITIRRWDHFGHDWILLRLTSTQSNSSKRMVKRAPNDTKITKKHQPNTHHSSS